MLCQRKAAHLMSSSYSSLGLVINHICKFVLRDLNIRKKKVVQQFFCNPLKHTVGKSFAVSPRLCIQYKSAGT